MSAQATTDVKPSGSGALRHRLPGSLAWHLGSLLVLAVILYPVVWVVGGSFKKSEDIVGSLDLLPSDPVLANYKSLATASPTSPSPPSSTTRSSSRSAPSSASWCPAR